MKKLNIFGGKENLRDVYPHATKWQVLKFKIRTLTRYSLRLITLTTVIGAAIVAAFLIGANSKEIKADVITATSTDTLTAKVDDLENNVVAQIQMCESQNHTEDDGLVVYDNNSKGTLSARNIPSIGLYQFKVPTVQHYEKMRSGSILSDKEAIELALDKDRAADLTKYIIFETQGGIFNWDNCQKALNLAPEVTVIKSLTK